jgi:hypothetical protein
MVGAVIFLAGSMTLLKSRMKFQNFFHNFIIFSFLIRLFKKKLFTKPRPLDGEEDHITIR